METIDKISYIETIERCQNITKASKELFVSQPYLSKLIKQLEEEMGIQIFNHSHHKAYLTYSGKRYLWYLKEISSLENKMKHELYLLKTNQRGEVSLGINSALASTFLSKVLPEFHKQSPGIDIVLNEQNQNISERMIISGEMELALGMAPLLYEQNLTYSSIFKEELYLLVPEISPLFDPSKNKSIAKYSGELSLVKEQPIILTPLDYGIGKNVARFFAKNNLNINPLITTSTVLTAVNLTMSGMGVTFIPKILVDRYISDEKCVVYSLDKNELVADYILIFKKDYSLSELSIKLYTSFLNILNQS